MFSAKHLCIILRISTIFATFTIFFFRFASCVFHCPTHWYAKISSCHFSSPFFQHLCLCLHYITTVTACQVQIWWNFDEVFLMFYIFIIAHFFLFVKCFFMKIQWSLFCFLYFSLIYHNLKKLSSTFLWKFDEVLKWA